MSHPDVADVCVVGVPDDYQGEAPLAFVVLSESGLKHLKTEGEEKTKAVLIKVHVSLPNFNVPCLTDIRYPQHVADVKVKYKRLTGGVEFIDVIPKNPSGKLLRRVLRDRARAMRGKKFTSDLKVVGKL